MRVKLGQELIAHLKQCVPFAMFQENKANYVCASDPKLPTVVPIITTMKTRLFREEHHYYALLESSIDPKLKRETFGTVETKHHHFKNSLDHHSEFET